MSHVVLLGDSIFDNGAYVGGEPDVVAQLGAILPPGWKASLRAIDGSVTDDVATQLQRLPADATHLVVSSGGNDALLAVDILGAPATSAADTLMELAGLSERFDATYRSMLERVRERALPTTVCTIYDGNFDDPMEQRLARTVLMVFNDVIVRAAVDFRMPLIDLRAICSGPTDYANPIEPSATGGQKIAQVIARLVQAHDFVGSPTSIYV